METTERYQRSLKRKNCSVYTVKNYMNRIHQFTRWLHITLPKASHHEIGVYVDHLWRKRRTPKTIACHLQTLHLFFDYLIEEEGMPIANPVTSMSICLPKPLPRCLKDKDVALFLAVITDPAHCTQEGP